MKKSTTLITGASEGLGKSLAIEAATRGYNLILIALPKSGLENLAKYLRINFDCDVFCIELDLTLPNAALDIFDKLKQEEIKVNILINNAGLGNLAWFKEKDLAFYRTQIDLNITNTVLLTRLFLEQADKSPQHYILNVGSLGGHFIVPGKLVYGATKSFIIYFTRCLQLELCGSNIHVSLLSPGGINTRAELLVQNNNLKGFAKATILEADFVAKKAFKGLLEHRKEIVPGLANRYLLLLSKLTPKFLKEFIIQNNMSSLLKSN